MSETTRLALPVVEPARNNDEFRNVLRTGGQTRPVLMTLRDATGAAAGRERMNR
ncbi:MAG: hypothetical protein H5U17_04330 [Defluviimonas sp.]|nr:hypothetical protein [Defluviimonas sp.]